MIISGIECSGSGIDVTDPWEHLLAMGLGAGFGNAVAKWEVRLQEDLDKKLSEVQSANKKRFIGKNASRLRYSVFAGVISWNSELCNDVLER